VTSIVMTYTQTTAQHQGACARIWKEPVGISRPVNGRHKTLTTSSVWYVREMAARVNSHFKYAHEKLQDASIRNLASIDQMVEDFKGEIPDVDFFNLLFRDLATGMLSTC
jgi:hypothetical protein